MDQGKKQSRFSSIKQLIRGASNLVRDVVTHLSAVSKDTGYVAKAKMALGAILRDKHSTHVVVIII